MLLKVGFEKTFPSFKTKPSTFIVCILLFWIQFWREKNKEKTKIPQWSYQRKFIIPLFIKIDIKRAIILLQGLSKKTKSIFEATKIKHGAKWYFCWFDKFFWSFIFASKNEFLMLIVLYFLSLLQHFSLKALISFTSFYCFLYSCCNPGSKGTVAAVDKASNFHTRPLGSQPDAFIDQPINQFRYPGKKIQILPIFIWKVPKKLVKFVNFQTKTDKIWIFKVTFQK